MSMPNYPNGNGVSYLGVRTIWTRPTFLFAVDTRGGPPAYMRVDSELLGDDERCVVVVRAEAFVQLWRQNIRGIHLDVAMRDPATWPLDYKYAFAERGFAAGEGNPVPLADVACHQDSSASTVSCDQSAFDGTSSIRSPPYLSISNGVTRSIWLMSNGASLFPVECRVKDRADLLAAEAGALGFSTQTVEQLFC